MAEAYANGCKTDAQVNDYVSEKIEEIGNKENSPLETIAENYSLNNSEQEMENTQPSDYALALESRETDGESENGEVAGETGDGAE